MFNQLTRSITALTLTAGLLSGSLMAVSAAPRPQEQKQQAAGEKIEKQEKDQKNQPEQTASLPAKPLSDKEDPRLIGKRKINTGLWAKMSGSLEKEVRLGQQVAAEIDRQVKFVDDPVITEYVNRVGQNVVLHSDAKIPFTIKVIDSDEVNAFALPGGFFYVNKGLVLAADNEAEVAGVMAHEIAHVTARHAMETQAKGTFAQIGLIAGSIFLGGIPGAILQNTAGLGLAAGFSKFSRDAEREADLLGVQYMWAAGYDPGAMGTMFEKLASQNKKKPGFLAKTFSTHPQSLDRLEASRALAARFPEREEYVVSTSEFQRVKARLLRLSNAKASTAGNIAGGEDGGPQRPTLKRRQPAPDSTTDGQPSEQKTNEPPKLKRRGDAPTPTPAPENLNQ
ncbi:MAG: M48 family metallopeptidase [Acidobacteriota bacterium]|nr:M48 family metallopeptidase [Acidobacteriota bacterium]